MTQVPQHHGMYGFNSLPEAAFKDTSQDKDTSRVADHDLYEIWRDVLFFTALGLFILSLAWWVNTAGMFSTYQALKWVYYGIHLPVALGFVYTWRKLDKTVGMSKSARNNLSVWRIRLTESLSGFVFVLLIHNLFGT